MRYLLLSMLFVLSVASKAEIYKWVDEKGRTHYGDSNMRPSGKSVEKLNLKINTYTNVSFENTGFFSEKVIMYSAEWCGFCKKARKHFSANRIPFVEYDIDRDQRAKRRYQKLGAKGVPVILYKGRRMNGFSEAGFKRLYAQDT